MLENQITLNPIIDSVATEVKFDRYRNQPTGVVYQGPNDLPSKQQRIRFTVSEPTQAGNFLGMRKSSAKYSRDHNVAGADATTLVKAPVIFALSNSVPAGMPAETIVNEFNHFKELISQEWFVSKLIEKLNI